MQEEEADVRVSVDGEDIPTNQHCSKSTYYVSIPRNRITIYCSDIPQCYVREWITDLLFWNKNVSF